MKFNKLVKKSGNLEGNGDKSVADIMEIVASKIEVSDDKQAT